MKIVTEKTKKLNEQEVSAEVNLGGDLEEAIVLFGKEIVFNAYLASAVIRARAAIVGLAVAGKTAEEIQAKMGEWKLGATRVTGEVSLGALLKKFEKLNPEKQKELIAKLLASSSPDEDASEPEVSA